MKILFVTDGLRSGGKERQLLELMKGLSLKSDCLYELVLMNENIHYKDVFDLGIKIHYLIRGIKKDPAIIFKLNRIIKDFRPDIIHSFSSMASFYTVILRLTNKFIFIDETIRSAPHRSTISYTPILLNYFNFKIADHIIANSQAGLDSYKAPLNKSSVIYNGFDMRRIYKLADEKKIKSRYNIKAEKIVGMVASFTDKKDYTTFLYASQKILKNRDDVAFLCIGDGKNLERCKEIVSLNYKDKIKFLGIQEEIESIINIFCIGVLITNLIKHGEGISNSIMEYMALAKPVIATDGGGTKELVDDGETGYLISQKSPEILAEKIEYLLDNEKRASLMGENGKRRIEHDFGIEKMVKSHYRLYNKLFCILK